MKNLIFAGLIGFTLFFSSCSEDKFNTESLQTLENTTIKSGQSFGFCIGKCYSEMSIKGKTVTLLVKETVSKGNSNVQKEYTYSDELSNKQSTELAQLIDFTKFKKNADTLGCPDCADGGAEWLAIEQVDLSKKITFEYGKEVPGQENLVVFLRSLRTGFLTKHVKE